MAAFMGPRVTEQVHRKSERDMLPLDYQAFNRVHHGGKVRTQDVESMRHCLVEGRRQGRRMTALESLLARLDAHEKAGDH
ncbi:hypothetical protein [Saccharopolyspora gloriosae]|uniref:hypothetical protein n=1 Tax=Saccharopolyspora gloriosae TaxID=455344 RepID=UPI001FB6805E|nr:hypothetical protein [Saccharopolyspora gloriosae]